MLSTDTLALATASDTQALALFTDTQALALSTDTKALALSTDTRALCLQIHRHSRYLRYDYVHYSSLCPFIPHTDTRKVDIHYYIIEITEEDL